MKWEELKPQLKFDTKDEGHYTTYVAKPGILYQAKSQNDDNWITVKYFQEVYEDKPFLAIQFENGQSNIYELLDNLDIKQFIEKTFIF